MIRKTDRSDASTGASAFGRAEASARSGPHAPWTRRGALKLAAGAASAAALAPFLTARPAAAQAVTAVGALGGFRSHGESLLGALKYGPDFPHFDYVDPDAPKGGLARYSTSAPFDSFNPFIAKGRSASGVSSFVFETLMEPSLDEGSTHYGLLAEWFERPKDDSWSAFRLRDEARWHDGREITVADVQKSFQLLIEQGHPLFRFYYKDVSEVVDEGDRIVRFRFSGGRNRELPHIVGQLNVLPAHWWEGRDFGETILEPVMGSGPYRIGAFEEGRYVEFERVEDYWGAALPVRVGTHNFDRVRVESFLDRDTEFEAFKKGDIDYWDENSASRWAERFDFPALRDGKVAREEPALDGPKAVQSFVFNLRRSKFSDRRTREALGLAFDFEWSNRTIFYEQYARPISYFQGTPDLMATGLPDAAELALLEPFRDQLPAEVFEKAFENPVTDGSGRNRRQLRRARTLLKEAGWTLQDKRLVDAEGAPFEIEFLAVQDAQARLVNPYLKNLEVLGVTARYRGVDAAQYIRRRRAYDFDMIIGGLSNSESPGNEQREYWGSAAAGLEGGRNLAGVENPAVDALIAAIIAAEDREALAAASRALDRVLLWEHYGVLELYTPFERIAYWKKFGRPETPPSRSIGFPEIWWYDAERSAQL